MARPSNAPVPRLAQGLYDPRNEHDACGVGFIAQMKGVKSHQIVSDGLAMLKNLTHRGAVGSDPLMGDGAGVLVQIPDKFFREEMAAQGRRAAARRPLWRRPCFMPQRCPSLQAHIEGIIAEVGAVRRTAASRLPRRSRRQFLAVQGAAHRRRGTGSPPGFHRPKRRHRNDDEYERRLYILRKVVSGRIYAENDEQATSASISCRCRRGPWSTRACSSPTRSAPITRI